MKRLIVVVVVLAVLFAASAVLITANDSQGKPEKTDGFVCPVLGGKAGEDHGKSSPQPIVGIGGGDSTVVGPNVNVPTHATNDNGAGTPGGDHASPGDPSYTGIWAK